MRLLVLHELPLGHKCSQTPSNIKNEWSDGSSSALIVGRWFLKLRSEDTGLAVQRGIGHISANG